MSVTALVIARRRAALGAAAVLLLTGCATAAAQSSPTWVPQQTVPPVPLPSDEPGSGGAYGGGAGVGTRPVTPALPTPDNQTSASSSRSPAQPSPGSSAATPSVPPSSSSQGAPAVDPNVVATKLSAPTGLVVLPDGTALVAERTTGRVMLVQPQPGTPAKQVMRLTGLDTAGAGGVLALALSATYSQDGLILALISTRTDLRVVHFTLGGPLTAILTGIPRGSVDNTGQLLVLPDGSILVGTGDAGSPKLAADPASLAGKVLRVDDIGGAAAGNPTPGSRVLTSGHDRVDGLCASPTGSAVYEVQADSTDKVNVLRAGASYGAAVPAAVPKLTKGIAGCAVAGSVLYVTGLGGKDVFSAPLTAGKIGAFSPMLRGKYGRLRTVVAAVDGTLWITTSNRDGHGTPVANDERVLHIRPSGGGGGSRV